MIPTIGYAANHSFSRLKPLAFERDPAGPGQVEIELLYCGICHSDIHQVKNEWSNTVYPCMPGHEMTGRVRAVGEGVTRHAVGDIVGVGCMVDSCRTCEPCRAGDQQYCEGPNGWLATYNGPNVPAKKAATGGNMYGRDNTFGGYSDVIVVREDFVLKIPAAIDPAHAAPILCAGVTTYSPLKHWNVKAGDKVGVVGLGGLGHMAVKLARAMGAEVTVFTRDADKRAEAEALGASHVAMEKDAKATMEDRSVKPGEFDLILSTIPEKHDVNPYVVMLKRDATLVIVGALEPMAPVNNQQVAFHRRSVAGSLIGSIAETQEVLDFCAEHGIKPDIQMIPIQEVNDAYKHVEKADVRFRYVIDLASLAKDRADAGGRSASASGGMGPVAAGISGGLVAGALTSAMMLATELKGKPSDLTTLERRSAEKLDAPHEPEPAPPKPGEQLLSHGGHFTLSVVSGALYGALKPRSASPIAAGLALGATFYGLAYGAVGPALGLTPPLTKDKPGSIAQHAAVHALFGLVTAVVADRLVKPAPPLRG